MADYKQIPHRTDAETGLTDIYNHIKAARDLVGVDAASGVRADIAAAVDLAELKTDLDTLASLIVDIANDAMSLAQWTRVLHASGVPSILDPDPDGACGGPGNPC